MSAAAWIAQTFSCRPGPEQSRYIDLKSHHIWSRMRADSSVRWATPPKHLFEVRFSGSFHIRRQPHRSPDQNVEPLSEERLLRPLPARRESAVPRMLSLGWRAADFPSDADPGGEGALICSGSRRKQAAAQLGGGAWSWRRRRSLAFDHECLCSPAVVSWQKPACSEC